MIYKSPYNSPHHVVSKQQAHRGLDPSNAIAISNHPIIGWRHKEVDAIIDRFAPIEATNKKLLLPMFFINATYTQKRNKRNETNDSLLRATTDYYYPIEKEGERERESMSIVPSLFAVD